MKKGLLVLLFLQFFLSISFAQLNDQTRVVADSTSSAIESLLDKWQVIFFQKKKAYPEEIKSYCESIVEAITEKTSKYYYEADTRFELYNTNR